jgi:hypothetical protein
LVVVRLEELPSLVPEPVTVAQAPDHAKEGGRFTENP